MLWIYFEHYSILIHISMRSFNHSIILLSPSQHVILIKLTNTLFVLVISIHLILDHGANIYLNIFTDLRCLKLLSPTVKQFNELLSSALLSLEHLSTGYAHSSSWSHLPDPSMKIFSNSFPRLKTCTNIYTIVFDTTNTNTDFENNDNFLGHLSTYFIIVFKSLFVPVYSRIG